MWFVHIQEFAEGASLGGGYGYQGEFEALGELGLFVEGVDVELLAGGAEDHD